MNQYQNPIELFHAILNNPRIINSLPKELISDIDFIEKYYIILGEEIKLYIPNKTYETLKHREVILKNKQKNQLENKPNITLENEIEILHNILTNPKFIENLPTNEKYSNDFLEFIYLIWGDEIKSYIPYEMFEEIKNEVLMHKYHQDYDQNREQWAKEEHQKVLKKIASKN